MNATINPNLSNFILFQNLISNMPMIFYALDENWTFTLSDGQGLQNLGLKPGQVVGLNAKEMYRDYPDIIEAIEEAFLGKSVQTEHILGDLYLENFIIPIYASTGKVEGIVGATIDITSRKKAQDQLKELNKTLEEKVHLRTNQLKISNEALIDANIELTEVNLEMKIMNEELTAINEEMTAMNEELIESNNKIVQMQSFLVESEKMAALGSLVAGVAHEVNTPLGVGITASSHLVDITKELLSKKNNGTLEEDELKDYLTDIGKASHIIEKNLTRAGKLTTSFKQLSVDQTSEPKRNFNVGEYLEEILISLSPSLKKKKIIIETNYEKQIMFTGSPGAFAQIITNLVMNALNHAYDTDETGIIKIEISKTEDRINMIFSDDGCGMDKQTLSKIYEPFFTTKRSLGGTGLGLSVVYSIVTQQFYGSIECTSEPNIGTTYTIILNQGGA